MAPVGLSASLLIRSASVLVRHGDSRGKYVLPGVSLRLDKSITDVMELAVKGLATKILAGTKS